MSTLNFAGTARLTASTMADKALELHFKLHECLNGCGTERDLEIVDQEIADMVLLMKQLREQHEGRNNKSDPPTSTLVSQLAQDVVLAPILNLKMDGGKRGQACTG